MIKIENVVTPSPEQWMATILGARNAMNSWARSDSVVCTDRETCEGCPCNTGNGCRERGLDPFVIGPNDHDLLMRLRNAGTDHRKYMRMLPVHVNVTAPLYLWKELDQYKIGTTTNSCSTMHKIHAKEFVLDDFSHERLRSRESGDVLRNTIDTLNHLRNVYINGGALHFEVGDGRLDRVLYEPKSKDVWDEMIQLLPSSYNQMRTLMLNYEVLANIYKARKGHKLIEWHEFCDFIERLPYSEFITGKVGEDGKH